ncbi:TPA: hypothetical protein ACKP1B_001746 [Serratia fonticola]
MSYNQKVWLAVLTVCTLFWLTLISAIDTHDKPQDRQREPDQQEQVMSSHSAKRSPTLAQAN